MNRPEKCPSRDWLDRLIDGNVTEEQENRLAKHLDHCERCRNQLSQLDDPDSRIQWDLEGMNQPGQLRHDETSLVRSKLSAIRSTPPEASGSSSGFADVVPWLEASETGIGSLAEFDLVRFVGRGGMGVVFEAFDRKLQRNVAIKVMSPGLLADTDACKRFLREARAAAKINHVNVVTVHRVDQVRGLPWLVMELIEGRSLEQQLRKTREHSVAEIWKIARQTALGLQAAHKCGITHRDIKPSNLMLDKNSKRIKIADFGLASTINETSLTRSGMLVGTPDFASPEQVNSQPVDARSDLFSLGSVLYLLCTKDHPFSGDSLIETLDAVRNRELPRVDLEHDKVPQDLAIVIDRLLQKRPEDRYQSASELLADIDRASKARRSGKPVVVAKPKNSTLSWGAAALAAALALPLVLFLIAYSIWSSADAANKVASMQSQPSSTAANMVPADASDPDAESGSLEESNRHSDSQIIVAENNEQLIDILEGEGDAIIRLLPGRTYELNSSLQLKNRELVIESDPDDHALVEAKNLGDAPAMTLEHCLLCFRSVDIRNSSETDREEPFLLCASGELSFEDTILICDSAGTSIEIVESEIRIESSVLCAQEILFVIYPLKQQEVFISDSVIVSRSNFELGGPSRLNIVAEDSQFLGQRSVSINEDDLEGFSLTLTARQCAFHAAEALVGLESESLSRNLLLGGISARFVSRIEDSVLPDTFLFAENDRDSDTLSWNETEIGLDPDTKIIEADEESVDTLMDRIFQGEFNTVQQVKEAITIP